MVVTDNSSEIILKFDVLFRDLLEEKVANEMRAFSDTAIQHTAIQDFTNKILLGINCLNHTKNVTNVHPKVSRKHTSIFDLFCHLFNTSTFFKGLFK